MDDQFWQKFPIEVLSEIFKFLSRKDRLSCSAVCQKWKMALKRRWFWDNLRICIDRDFYEPSTILVVREFHEHVKSLEIGWEKPQVQYRWLPVRVQDLTKRVIRFIVVLLECSVEINCVKMFEWYGSHPFKKVMYHFRRFLYMQTKLKKLVFQNFNLPASECNKILEACSSSKDSISHLEMHNYLYHFDSRDFADHLRLFPYLEELKLDYFLFSKEQVIDVVAENGKHNRLRLLEIYFDEIDIHGVIVPEDKWRRLTDCCPQLKVSYCIKNICHFEHIEFLFIMQSVPLTYFSLATSNKFDQRISRQFQATLSRLIGIFHGTLEIVNLDIKNNKENLDSLLLGLIGKCPKLKKLLFDGMISDNMDIFSQICRLRNSAKGLTVKVISQKYQPTVNIVHMFS